LGKEDFILMSFFQDPVAVSRQSAANRLFSGRECGALPGRRYAGKFNRWLNGALLMSLTPQ
jgi:hypothetical protein